MSTVMIGQADDNKSHSHSISSSGAHTHSTNSTGEHNHLLPTTRSSPGTGTSPSYLNFSTTSSVGTNNSQANSGFAKGSSYRLPYSSSGLLNTCIGVTGEDIRTSAFFCQAGVTTLSGYHSHSIPSGGSHTHTSNPSGGVESNPVNITYRLWKRTA